VESASRCAGAIAIGAGYVQDTCSRPVVAFPPRHATHWLFWFAVIGVIAAAVDALVRPKGTVRFVAWAIVCTIACRLILQPKFSYAWSAAEGWLRVFAIALAIVVLTLCLDLVERRSFGAVTLFSVTTVLCGGTSVALILSGSLLLGQLACIFSTTVATCFLLIIAVRPPFHPNGAAAPLSLVCAGLWSAVYSMRNYRRKRAATRPRPAAPCSARQRESLSIPSVAYRTALVGVPVASLFLRYSVTAIDY
jgi:hypothetical protein